MAREWFILIVVAGSTVLLITVTIIVVVVKNLTAEDVPVVSSQGGNNDATPLSHAPSEEPSGTEDGKESPVPILDANGQVVPNPKKPKTAKPAKVVKDVVFPDPLNAKDTAESFHDGEDCDDAYEKVVETWDALASKPTRENLHSAFDDALAKAKSVCPKDSHKRFLQPDGPLKDAEKLYAECKSKAESEPGSAANVSNLEKALVLTRLFKPDFEAGFKNAAHVLFKFLDPKVKDDFEKIKTTPESDPNIGTLVSATKGNYKVTAQHEKNAKVLPSDFYAFDTLEMYIASQISGLLPSDLSDAENRKKLDTQISTLKKVSSNHPILQNIGALNPDPALKEAEIIAAADYVKGIQKALDALISLFDDIKAGDLKFTNVTPPIAEIKGLRNTWNKTDISELKLLHNPEEADIVKHAFENEAFRKKAEEKLTQIVKEVFLESTSTADEIIKAQIRVGAFIKTLRDNYKFKPKSPEFMQWLDIDSIRLYFSNKIYSSLLEKFRDPNVDDTTLFNEFTKSADVFSNKLQCATTTSIPKNHRAYVLFVKKPPTNATELRAILEKENKPFEEMLQEVENVVKSSIDTFPQALGAFEEKFKAAKTTKEFQEKFSIADPKYAADSTYILKCIIGESILKRKGEKPFYKDQQMDAQMLDLLRCIHRLSLDQSELKDPKNATKSYRFKNVFELELQTIDLSVAKVAELKVEDRKLIEDFLKIAPTAFYCDVQPTVVDQLNTADRILDVLKMSSSDRVILANYLFSLSSNKPVTDANILAKIPESFKEKAAPAL